jgi:hypothetical protein
LLSSLDFNLSNTTPSFEKERVTKL